MSGSSTGDIETRLGGRASRGAKPVNSAASDAAMSPTRVAVLCLGSITSSVALIVVNKTLMQFYGFRFVFSLTFLHMTVTAITLRLVSHGLGWFELRPLPLNIALAIAGAGVGSIGLMNLSMYSNSLGTYQLFKLLCVPAILILKFLSTGEMVSKKIMVSLAILLTGVGIATVTDVSLNMTGVFFGVLATIATAQFQIYQGSVQGRCGVTSVQATAAVTPYQAVMCLVIALFVEVPGEDSVLNFELSAPSIILLIMSCTGAIAVNLVSFALIGKTSAVTYQVVGHLKTILILTFSYMFFAQTSDAENTFKNLAGVVTAMLGVILYGHLKVKAQNNEPDVLDSCLK